MVSLFLGFDGICLLLHSIIPRQELQSLRRFLAAIGLKPTNPTWRRSIPSAQKVYQAGSELAAPAEDNSGENELDLDQDTSG